MVTYTRVVPRDFFNESKLLKCLGKFEICVIDKMCDGLPIVTDMNGSQSFNIQQDPTDGSLYCSNYRATLGDEEIWLCIPYNSKDEWPLLARFRGEEYCVFDKQGKFMPNFGWWLDHSKETL